ncbi:MAG TPA: TetR/AcrR family transcriptional regulator [Candidatus Limnocylindrales bacterium]|nr:TetR/AcrR family transcriptional regulator [Candidatus Limnocylindrales bacterium]
MTDGRTPAPVRPGPAPGSPRASTEEAFLDAAERLLITVGYAGVSTRVLADEAGANPGLVHYYFGSMDNVFLRVLERFTERLIARQREMYGADIPFIEKWRQAMHYLDVDRPYQKVWYELQAMAWNKPELRERVAWVNGQWRAVLTEAFAGPRERYGLTMPLDALVALVMAFNEGMIFERLAGIESGHAALLEWIDAWLATWEQGASE